MTGLRRVWIAVLAVVVLAGLGWPALPGQAAGPKDEVVIGIAEEPDLLFPGLGGNLAVTHEVWQALFAEGVRRDEHWKLIPMQAREVPTLENGLWKLLPDGKMQLTWHLKPLTWQDGVPVTAEDYVFTHRAIMNDKVPVVSRNFEKRVENVYAPDPGTLVVTYKEHYAYANTGIIQTPPWPRHLLEKTYHDNSGGLDKLPYGNDPKATIGDGPYRIVSWQKGSSIVAEADPHYTLEKPTVKRIVWRVITDTNTLVANMLSGSVDALSPIGITFDQAVQLDQQQKLRRLAEQVQFTQGLVWEHIDVNLNNPKLKDKRVRQALLYAIDRQAMVQNLFQGKQPVAGSYLPPKHYGYDSSISTKTYNPDRARQLFAEAGWMPGPDGILRNAQGERFTVTIGTTAGNRVREDVQQIISKPVAERRCGSESQQSTGPGVFRRDHPAQRVRAGDVCLGAKPDQRLRIAVYDRQHPIRAERLQRAKLRRVLKPRDGQGLPRNSHRARSGEARGDAEAQPADSGRRTSRVAALLPRRCDVDAERPPELAAHGAE